MAFKVGDKVTHRTFGAGEIAFGPFEHSTGPDHYLMKDEYGRHSLAVGEAMQIVAKFSVGDVVSSFGDTHKVVAGPFRGPYATWYAVEDKDGDVVSALEDDLKAVEPAKDEPLKPGDVIRIPRDGLQFADVKAGDLLVVEEATPRDVTVHAAPGARQLMWYFDLERVERVDPATVAVVDTVAYDLSARYRDREGDYWRFERRADGSVRGNCSTYPLYAVRIYDDGDTLEEAVRRYGPLTRV